MRFDVFENCISFKIPETNICQNLKIYSSNRIDFLVIYPRGMICITLPLFHQTNLYNLKICFVPVENGKLYISSSLHPGPKVVELFLHAICCLCKTYFFQNCKKYLSDLKKIVPPEKLRNWQLFMSSSFHPTPKVPGWKSSHFDVLEKHFFDNCNSICYHPKLYLSN